MNFHKAVFNLFTALTLVSCSESQTLEFVNIGPGHLPRGENITIEVNADHPEGLNWVKLVVDDAHTPKKFEAPYVFKLDLIDGTQRIKAIAEYGSKQRWMDTELRLNIKTTYEEVRKKQPNIILIVADDLGYADAGYTMKYTLKQVYGAHWESEIIPEVVTPNIDGLASRGVTFTDGYASGSVCSPTRAGLMIGRYQQRVGIYDAGAGGHGMEQLAEGRRDPHGGRNYRPVNPILPEFLKQTGTNSDYVSGVFGKWHLGLDQNYVLNHSSSWRKRKSKRRDVVYTDPPADQRPTEEVNLYPTDGPIIHDDGSEVTSGIPEKYFPLPGGSPWHALNRGFDTTFYFMGRGGHDYWDPNGIHISTDPKNPVISQVYREDTRRNPGYGSGKDDDIPTDAWDRETETYKIHKERTSKNYLTNRIVDHAISFIRSNENRDRPFFAYIPFNAPHFPAQVPYHMSKDGILNSADNLKRRYAGMDKNIFKKLYLRKDPDPTDDHEVNVEIAWLKGKDLAETFNNSALDGWFPDPLFIYDMYKDEPHGLADFSGGSPDNDRDRRLRSITVSMVRWLDRGIGKIIRALKDKSVYEDTVIFFLSDNGGPSEMRASNKPLQGTKHTTWEGGTRVPFFLAWDRYLQDIKGEDRRGARISTPVIALDILPTILKINRLEPLTPDACLKTPHAYDYRPDGESLLPLIDDPENSALNREYIFWSQNGDERNPSDGAVRKGKWKLRVIKHKGDAVYELYDLGSDLNESNDIASSHPAITEELKNAYRVWMNNVAKSNFEKTPNMRLPIGLRFVQASDELIELM